MDLTYSVPSGRYGTRADLANNGETFGTQGAVVCVIVMVIKADGTLFCGHMDCGYSGQPGNQQAVTDGARALVQAALPNDQATVNWWLAGRAGDPTSIWMRNGIKNYFNNDPLQDSDDTTDAAFIRNAGVTNVIFGNDFNNGVNIDSGAFSDSP